MADDAAPLKLLIQQLTNDRELLSAVLSGPIHPTNQTASRIDLRQIESDGSVFFQWSRQRGDQVFHENHTAQETAERLCEAIGGQYRHVHLRTSQQAWSARYSKKGACRLRREQLPQGEISTDHNRSRPYLIPAGSPVPFLVETGIMTADGTVRTRHQRKFRQINRYVEFIADVASQLPVDEVIRIVDFGCGKSYLTFATHYYLTFIAGRRVDIIGLDRRSDVIATCRKITEKLGLTGVRFEQGDISNCRIQPPVHLAISLHACDTATDDAIAEALHWQSDAILAVPCCQHELHAAGSQSFPLVQRHGILHERICALSTDAIRAAVLEAAGYQTQVMEFIDLDHTPKNILIRAVRRGTQVPVASTEKLAELQEFCDVFGIPPLHLQRTLEERGFPGFQSVAATKS